MVFHKRYVNTSLTIGRTWHEKTEKEEWIEEGKKRENKSLERREFYKSASILTSFYYPTGKHKRLQEKGKFYKPHVSRRPFFLEN